MQLPSLPLLGGALALLVGAVQANDCLSVALTAIPACAQGCYLEGAPTIGCDGLNFACQCDKQAAMFAAIESCVVEACKEIEFSAVIDGAAQVCECACPSGVVGTVTVGTVAPGTVVPVPTGSYILGTVVPGTVLAQPTSGSGSGSDKGAASDKSTPTKSSPTHFATSSVVAGAERLGASGVGLFLAGAAAAVMVL